ncbi:hypothetical protein M0802_003404 [Mischocyttarus mexicanus]|nr:hypothetical protein M0802_003404 [Mischocyttarus mexicanus]
MEIENPRVARGIDRASAEVRGGFAPLPSPFLAEIPRDLEFSFTLHPYQYYHPPYTPRSPITSTSISTTTTGIILDGKRFPLEGKWKT